MTQGILSLVLLGLIIGNAHCLMLYAAVKGGVLCGAIWMASSWLRGPSQCQRLCCLRAIVAIALQEAQLVQLQAINCSKGRETRTDGSVHVYIFPKIRDWHQAG